MNLTIKQTENLIEFFQLKTRRDGHYQTAWGHKTLEGLRLSVERIISDEGEFTDEQMDAAGYKRV